MDMGPFFHNSQSQPKRVSLRKDLVRSLKRGHPWVYADALKEVPKCSKGAAAILSEKNGSFIAQGYLDPSSPLAFRVLSLEKKPLDDHFFETRIQRAIDLRKSLFDFSQTDSFRLFNGEGDGLAGLVCDVYGKAAVMQLDGDGPRGFWNIKVIAKKVAEELSLEGVYLKNRTSQGGGGEILFGSIPEKVQILENSARFEIDIAQGQKTGFFLDQRDNRYRIRNFSKGKKVLNVFGYTGGFSVSAGLAGASHVTTVDIAAPAIDAANTNWTLNDLSKEKHVGQTCDAYEFLQSAINEKNIWDLVIVDPPSFAPSKKSFAKAKSSYEELFALAAKTVTSGGILAPSSCSSHISQENFFEITQNAISKARRRGTVLGAYGQAADHPYPMACPELRYLKFALIRIED